MIQWLENMCHTKKAKLNKCSSSCAKNKKTRFLPGFFMDKIKVSLHSNA